MEYAIINLTFPIVVKEIEDILHDYPKYPYQVAFSIHKMRQNLIAHVMSQIPNQYTVVEVPHQLTKTPDRLYSPLQERLDRESIIHKSILHILRKNSDWIDNESFKTPQPEWMQLN